MEQIKSTIEASLTDKGSASPPRNVLRFFTDKNRWGMTDAAQKVVAAADCDCSFHQH